MRGRISKFSEIKNLFEAGEFKYFFQEPNIDQNMLVWKGLKDDPDGLKKTKEYLAEVRKILENVNEWNIENIKSAISPYAVEKGNGNVLWPMRVALSGKEKSPDPFELAEILGKEITLQRLSL